MSYPGCRHGHVTNPLRKRGHRLSDIRIADRLHLTLPLVGVGWGASELATPARSDRQKSDKNSAVLGLALLAAYDVRFKIVTVIRSRP